MEHHLLENDISQLLMLFRGYTAVIEVSFSSRSVGVPSKTISPLRAPTSGQGRSPNRRSSRCLSCVRLRWPCFLPPLTSSEPKMIALNQPCGIQLSVRLPHRRSCLVQFSRDLDVLVFTTRQRQEQPPEHEIIQVDIVECFEHPSKRCVLEEFQYFAHCHFEDISDGFVAQCVLKHLVVVSPPVTCFIG